MALGATRPDNRDPEESSELNQYLTKKNKKDKDDRSLLEIYQDDVWEIDLNDKEKERLLGVISKQVDEYERDNEEFFKDLIRWEDQYEGFLPPKDFPWEGCANYHDPITEMNVNAIYARIIRRFRSMDYLRVKIYKQNKDRALLTQKYMRWLFEKRVQYTDLQQTTARDTIKYGTGVYITTWEYKEETKTVVEPTKRNKQVGTDIDGTPLYEEEVVYEVKEKTRVIQQPKVEWVSLFDYFRSEETNRFVQPEWEARRIYMSGTKFQEMADCEEYDSSSVAQIVQKLNEGKSADEQAKTTIPEREIIQWWGWIKLKTDSKKADRVVFTYDRKDKKFLKIQRFPYLFNESNFTVVNFERRTGTWRGRGICQKLEHVNREADKLHDIYLDSCAMVTAKAFKKKKGVDSSYLFEPFYPGVVWEVQKMDDIDVIATGDVPVSPLRELEQLDLKASKQTGIGSMQVGQDSGQVSQPTASGQLAIIQEGNIGLDETAKEWMAATIKISRMIHSMIKQFRPEEEFLMIMEEQNEIGEFIDSEVSVDQLVDDPELLIVDRSVMEEQENKNKAVELYNVVIKDPILSSNSRMYKHVLDNLFTAYKTMDSDLILPTQEEIEESMEKIAKTAELQNMQLEMQKMQMQMQAQQLQAQVKQQQIEAQVQMQREKIASDEAQAKAQLEQDGALAERQQNMDVAQKIIDSTGDVPEGSAV